VCVCVSAAKKSRYYCVIPNRELRQAVFFVCGGIHSQLQVSEVMNCCCCVGLLQFWVKDYIVDIHWIVSCVARSISVAVKLRKGLFV
jgi:hypothetical protein